MSSVKDIIAGDYIARARNMKYVESKMKGTPGMEVQFEFEDKNGQQRLSWTGWLSDGAKKRTIETLVNVLDYNGSEETDDFGNFLGADTINRDKDVKLVIETNEGGWPEIKWVNNVGAGGGKFKDVEPTTIKSKLAGLGIRASVLAEIHDKKSAAHDAAQRQPPQQRPPAFKKDEEIPF